MTDNMDEETETRGSSSSPTRSILKQPIHSESTDKTLADDVQSYANSVNQLKIKEIDSQTLGTNIENIVNVSKILTNEANNLKDTIRALSADMNKTKCDICSVKDEDTVDFPYHLFLLELIVNDITMKCDCFELDVNNVMITASFLGKTPIAIYDSSYGKIESFKKLNVGKSILFAMTYDKICSIKEFEIHLEMSKHPPCSHCVTKLAETRMDYSKDFLTLKEELCKKWTTEQPEDNIICTTSTPLNKGKFYLSCGDSDNPDAIGIIEISCRMSFLGKEITTAFSPKNEGTSLLMKDDTGITMYSCQKVEMDEGGKVMLDEDVLNQSRDYQMPNQHYNQNQNRQYQQMNPSPPSYANQNGSYQNQYGRSPYNSNVARRPSSKYNEPLIHLGNQDPSSKYDEIYTQMNTNELKIRVPKSSKVERMGQYDRLNELCECDENPYNGGDQVQFEMPKDLCRNDKTHNNYSSNLKYTYTGCDRSCETKDRKTINITPTNCPAPVNMEKVVSPNKDVFILKIGKKLETEFKKTDLEIELVTPKMPTNDVLTAKTIAQQYSSTSVGKDKKKGKGKGKDKGKSKGKDKGKGKGKGKKK